MAALVLPSTANADSGNSTRSSSCSAGTIALTGSETLWPPNHKFRPYAITATSNLPNDRVNLTSMVGNSDVVDGEELNGSGNTLTDVRPNPATGSGPSPLTVGQEIRGERSGHSKAGRTYTFDIMANFGMGTMPCAAQFTVTVPHDQRKKTAVSAQRIAVRI